MLLTKTCYYWKNQVFGGATNRDKSLIKTCFYSRLYGILENISHLFLKQSEVPKQILSERLMQLKPMCQIAILWRNFNFLYWNFPRGAEFLIILKVSYFEKSFWCHRLDQNSNENIVRISALKFFVASWGLLGSFLGLPRDLISNIINKEAYRKPKKLPGSYKNFQGRNPYNIFVAILV